MRTFPFLGICTTAAACVLLSNCSGRVRSQFTLEDRLRNPLFAEQYWADTVKSMVDIAIKNDPLLQDSWKKSVVDSVRETALQEAKGIDAKRREGTSGFFIGQVVKTEGHVLYVDDTLYVGTNFFTTPGRSLHLYLSTVVDPRDVDFPDDTSMDLGSLESPYGPQQYTVGAVENPLLYRTVVIWDTELERMHGFAQLNKDYGK